MSGDHNMYQKTKSYLNDDFECPRCGHCCHVEEEHMTDRELMQQALEALESDPISHAGLVSRKQAITALRQALVDADDTSQKRVDEKAKREQKPVAWRPQVWRQFRPDGTLEFQKIKRTPNGEWEDYTAPQRREWVGLTANEIWECNKASGNAVEFHICYEHQNVEDFAEAIEAKLKEKNQ